MFLLHIWVIFLVFGATDFINFFFGGGGREVPAFSKFCLFPGKFRTFNNYSTRARWI